MTQKDPIQLKSGAFGCPDCKTALAKSLVPYFEDGSFLGAFDGLRCPMCHYSMFSEKKYEDLQRSAYQAGTIQRTALVSVDGETVFLDSFDAEITSNISENISKYNDKEFTGESTTDLKHMQKPMIKPGQ